MEEYVQVPVPKRFVAQVYGLLAQLSAAESGGGGEITGSPALPSRSTGSTPDALRMDFRYQRLGEALVRLQSDLLRLTMEQLEQICGGHLPDSAYKHRAWWANTDSHSHAQSWRRAGFRVARVEFDREKRVSAVLFQRIDSLRGAS